MSFPFGSVRPVQKGRNRHAHPERRCDSRGNGNAGLRNNI